MSAIGATMRSELIGLGGIVERNVYLTKRYFLWDVAFMFWTIANTLTIVFIARSVHLTHAAENTLATRLLVGGSVAMGAGIAKELWDLAGHGDPSWRDLTWDALGTAFGLVIAWTVDHFFWHPRQIAGATTAPARAPQ